MNADEAIGMMVAPGQNRPNAWRGGVIQIHVTRACNLACANCTQGSQFSGKSEFITPENFRTACESLAGYFGVVGVFGGNPALHPQFETLCEILSECFPKEQRGIWCNDPKGKAGLMRKVFNPSVSNLNVHQVASAFSEFKRDWPESRPFGLEKDSLHAPVHGAFGSINESERWEKISRCSVNREWSAMICQINGKLKVFFCEVAGSQAILNAVTEAYPETGMDCHPGWWKRPVADFSEQIMFHCLRCLVPLQFEKASGNSGTTTVGDGFTFLKPKGSHSLSVLTDGEVSADRKLTEYI